jgi:tRNA pseudouridine13 synthase
LLSFFSAKTIGEIVALNQLVVSSTNRRANQFGQVVSDTAVERPRRHEMHEALRRIFDNNLESRTEADGSIVVCCSQKGSHNSSDRTDTRGNGRGGARGGRGGRGGRDSRQGASGFSQPKQMSWKERGGDYLHFSLYKENKDTMEVISFLSRTLGVTTKTLNFAGTKDRRAVTVQRVSAYRVSAEKVAAANHQLRNGKVGNYEYRPHALELGEQTGNEFVITLRDCQFPGSHGLDLDAQLALANSVVGTATTAFKGNGFINYFGSQRFGTFNTGTHKIGLLLLQGDLKAAIDKLLSFEQAALVFSQDLKNLSHYTNDTGIASDDLKRAKALDIYHTTGHAEAALQELPRKFSAESALIKHLSHSPNDHKGALMTVNRPLRTMYVHAYQSFIWNMVAGMRLKQQGLKVVEGDLIMIDEHEATGADGYAVAPKQQVDEDGEEIFEAEPEVADSNNTEKFRRARLVTKAEAESGRFSIFDIVLPTPGWDVIYPGNFSAAYTSLMSGDGLDPFNMRRSWKDLSLSGNYRKVLSRVSGLEYEVKPYIPDEQLVETDLEKLNRLKEEKRQTSGSSRPGPSGQNLRAPAAVSQVSTNSVDANSEDGRTASNVHEGEIKEKKIAVVLKFKLGTSQYATVALRELLKEGGLRSYKPEYSR